METHNSLMVRGAGKEPAADQLADVCDCYSDGGNSTGWKCKNILLTHGEDCPMNDSPMAWMMEPWAQLLLLAAGCFASWSLWRFSRRPVKSLWSIGWRMYVAAILTAGIPWVGGKEPFYVLYWTMLAKGSPLESKLNMAVYIGLIQLISIYWVIYLLLFLLIRFLLADPEE